MVVLDLQSSTLVRVQVLVAPPISLKVKALHRK
jgi:hypothetical protein